MKLPLTDKWLGLGFGTLVAMLVAVGWLMLNQSAHITNSFDQIINNHLIAANLAGQALRYSSTNNVMRMEVFLTSDVHEREVLSSVIEQNAEKISGLIERIGRNLKSAEELELLKSVKELRGAHKDSYARALHLRIEGDRPEDARLMLFRETQPLLEKYRLAWTALLQFEVRQIDLTAQAAREKNNQTVRGQFVLILLAVCGSIAVALFAMRGLAVQSAEREQAREALRRANNELELRVQERTGRLNSAIAEQRRANEQLWVQTKAMEAAANGIVITDRAGKILWTNPAFTALTGYSAEEAAGRNPSVLKSGRHQKEFYQNLWQRISAGEIWSGEIVNRRKDGTVYTENMTISPMLDADGTIVRFVAIKEDVSQRKRAETELRWKTAFLEAQISSSTDGILVVDGAGKKLLQNQRFNEMWKFPQQVIDDPDHEKTLRHAMGKVRHSEQFVERAAYLNSQPDEIGHDELELTDGSVFDRHSRPVVGEDGTRYGRIWVFRDITDRKRAEEKNKRMELQLRHAQKMESIGQLAAGIAHEINTPTQFIGDNTRFLKDAFADVLRVLDSHRELFKTVMAGAKTEEAVARVDGTIKSVDLDYVVREIPQAVEQSLDGVDRVARIVRAMKEFSHPGTNAKTFVDLNRCLESTLTVCRNEWKYVAELKTDFDPLLPPVICLPGELNQTFLNIIVNAAHAIREVVGDDAQRKGLITVTTRRDGDFVEVRIADTGRGIPESARTRVFDPFFTTKPVGKGTGQGLAIAHSVVVDKHGGSICFETEIGKGTSFIVRLPLKP